MVGTCSIWLALHLQVDRGQAQLVALLQCCLLLGAPHGAAHAQAASHSGHLLVELFPCDLVVKAQPAELDLHPGGHRIVSVGAAQDPGWQRGWGRKRADLRVVHVLWPREGLQRPVKEAVEENQPRAAGPDHKDDDERGTRVIDELPGTMGWR